MRNAVIGDMVAISTRRGWAVFQYIAKDRLLGCLIRVLENFWNEPPAAQDVATDEATAFYTFLPLNAALSRGLVLSIGNRALAASNPEFPLMRKRGQIARGGQVLNWWLWDGQRQWRVDKLTPDQGNLSIAEIVNDTLLIERLEKGWRPSDSV